MVNTSLKHIAWAVVALSLAVSTTANAAFTLIFDDTVTVTPGGTVTAPVRIVSSPATNVDSVNPALQVAGGGIITMSSFSAGPAGTIWDGRTISQGSSNALPTTATRFNVSSTNGSVVANGIVLNVTFTASAAATPGSMFDVNFIAPPETSIANLGVDLGMISFDHGKITVVPEPSPFLLLGLCGGLGVVGNWVRRKWFCKK